MGKAMDSCIVLTVVYPLWDKMALDAMTYARTRVVHFGLSFGSLETDGDSF